ncbi:hypothetical protein ACIB24_19770 [Spongisporangium articulatum]|uniref:Uncharacterized protein n=1 Tax=Spongisporangium articulatum TaxID=3362603 RepID=A0ABW8AUL8_9ACTN
MITDSHDARNDEDAIQAGTGDLEIIRHATDDPDAAPPELSVVGPSVVASVGPDGLVIDLRDRPQDRLTPALEPFLTAEVLTEPKDVDAARRLAASVYVRYGYAQAGDLTVEGTLDEEHDPWVVQSTYFGVLRDGRPVASARQIMTDRVEQLPGLRLPGLFPDDLTRLTALRGDEVIEISQVVRSRGAANLIDATAVYVRMWQHSLQKRHQAWVLAIDSHVYRQVRTLLSGDAMRPIGPELEYFGSLVIPSVIWLDETNAILTRRALEAPPDDPLTPLLPHLFPHPAR